MTPPRALPDKRELIRKVVDALVVTRAMMAAAADDSRRGATHPESRSEGSKDMRSTEQSYLARGQALRVDELDEQIQRLRHFEAGAFGGDDDIAVGALVVLEDESDDDPPRTVFLLPFGGGTEVKLGDDTITVVTGVSPLGQALLGRGPGDEVELRRASGLKVLSVAAVY